MNVIAQLRKEKGWKQEDLAFRLGVKRSTISKYENQKIPLTGEALQTMAEIFEVSVDYLLGREKDPSVVGSLWIPVYACYPSLAEELEKAEIVDQEEISPQLAQKGEYLAFVVSDNSMAPKILAKDVVIIRREQEWQDGEIKAVSWQGGAVFLRRLKAISGGIMLLAENSDYDPLFVSSLEAKYFQIWGRLVELRRKF